MNKKNLLQNRVPKEVKLLLKLFLIGIVLSFFCRLFFLYIHVSEYSFVEFLQVVFIGFRLDLVIISSVLLFAIFIILLFLFTRVAHVFNIGMFIIYLFFSLSFFIALADVVFFTHYKTHITISALHWIDSPLYMMKMILGEIKNWIFLFFFLLQLFFLFILFKKIKNNFLYNFQKNHTFFYWLLIITPLLVLGVRGRTESKSTINWGVAMFSKNYTLNMAAINPSYFFIKSLKWKNGNSIVPELSLFYCTQFLKQNITTPYAYIRDTTLIRHTAFPEQIKKHNVVLIISESLGLSKTGLYSHGKKLTPFTDSIAKQGLYFSRFFADGIHTFNGIYASLIGLPSFPLNHSLKQYLPSDAGLKLPKILHQNGYKTVFYTTHDKHFDNQYGFTKLIGFEKVISQENFFSADVIGVTGVSDHLLFEKAYNDMVNNTTPFFTCILTGTDHPPYDIPASQTFLPPYKEKDKNATAYADWALKNFINKCKEKTWFSNTIFIITGDHGAIINADDDMYLSKLSVPLIIYAPDIFKDKKEVKNIAGQIDIPATILGLLNIPYTNTSFGIDLLREKRNYISATYDDALITLDTLHLYVKNKDTQYLFEINESKQFLKKQLYNSKRDAPYKLFPLCTYKLINEYTNSFQTP